MRSELIVKTKSLAGTSDLTLLATIKPGLVPALESLTYNTRAKRLLKTLHGARSTSHEYSLLKPFSDAVERVGKIHSVRVAVLEPDNKILLAATFDGAWEAYIRVLWQKVGALLDVIFCNTIDYVTAVDHTYEEWSVWARRVQVESHFFYSIPETTASDIPYLRKDELLQRKYTDRAHSDKEATAQTVRPPELVARDQFVANVPRSSLETGKQAIQALAVLYRLTDSFAKDTGDDVTLHRAARSLLQEFVHAKETDDQTTEVTPFKKFLAAAQTTYGKQLDWLLKQPVIPRPVPVLPVNAPIYEFEKVQGGIVRPYEPVTHGCLAFVAFDDAQGASEFLTHISNCVTTDAQQREFGALPTGTITVNIGFTEDGLRAAGLSEADLECFPLEFREGMSARASILGDFRTNHPRRWRLPTTNWPKSATASDESRPIELAAIHAVVQLRVSSSNTTADPDVITSDKHPLFAEVQKLATCSTRARVLGVQALRRHVETLTDSNGKSEQRTVEHFGFADGESQPTVDPNTKANYYTNQMHLGEILIGHDNEADFSDDPAISAGRREWLNNGSFLVVRKLAQDVESLYKAAELASTRNVSNPTSTMILEKMMGRRKDGTPLITNGGSPLSGDNADELEMHGRNDFNYARDHKGQSCPFQAHVRRVNPRMEKASNFEPLGRRTPRLVRSGMSYGPRYIHDEKNSARETVNKEERGLVFMAYNASIGEQFEVIQRWISGANSVGTYSGQSDPLLGVAPSGERKHFRFRDGEQIVHVELDGADKPLDDPRPFVRLEWGIYLFAPSIPALEKIRVTAENQEENRRAPVWSEEKGLEHIIQLKQLEDRCVHAAVDAWKSTLEDPTAREKFISASVWAAIRKYFGGALRTPYGVLVADRQLVMHAFSDPGDDLSVCGYLQRMDHSIGKIYLGLDRGAEYDRQATESNAAIQKITRQQAFDSTKAYTAKVLEKFVLGAKAVAQLANSNRWDVTVDLTQILDNVLAYVCREWFGLPDVQDPMSDLMKPGGVRWDWEPGQPIFYPGHFLAPSRFMFQPQPGPKAEELGCKHGQALREKFVAFVNRHRKLGTHPRYDAETTPGVTESKVAELCKDLFDAFPKDNDMLARVLVGTMIGLIPPVDGNFKLSLNEWLRDGTFWHLRSLPKVLGATELHDPANSPLLAALIKSMQLKPSPEIVWRTAKCAVRIGEVDVKEGEVIAISIVSATQQCLAAGHADIFPIFGGNRRDTANVPTHACPGYEAAMGVLLGLLDGLVSSKYTMRPTPVPLSLQLEGFTSPPAPALTQTPTQTPTQTRSP